MPDDLLRTVPFLCHIPSSYKSSLYPKTNSRAGLTYRGRVTGGDIIIGLEEEKGTAIAKAIHPVQIKPDDEIRRLEGIARTGLDPRLPSLEFKEIEVDGKGYLLVIHIRKSWLAPHRISFKEGSRFYTRNSKGAELLDTGALRNAFTLAETITDRIRNFRNERIIQLLANDTPVPFEEGAKVILHIVPVNAFNAGQRYNVMSTYNASHILKPISGRANDRRVNLDGVVWYSLRNDSASVTDYVQIYHNGIIEAVNHHLLRPRENFKVPYVINGSILESDLFGCLKENLQVYSKLGIEAPAYIFLTLTGVKGYEMMDKYYPSRFEGYPPIDRDVLMIPEILVEDFSVPIQEFMRPIIDQVWNACGAKGSVNYDADGNWNPNIG